MSNMADSEFGREVGLVHKAIITGRKVGADRRFWTRLADDTVVFRKVVQQVTGIDERTYSVDLDADPWCPRFWRVDSHKRGGRFLWDPDKANYYLSEYKAARSLRKANGSPPAFNANLLDFLLDNPQLLTPEWEQEGCITFDDTSYRLIPPQIDDLYRRSLCFCNGKWYWAPTHIYWEP